MSYRTDVVENLKIALDERFEDKGEPLTETDVAEAFASTTPGAARCLRGEGGSERPTAEQMEAAKEAGKRAAERESRSAGPHAYLDRGESAPSYLS